MLKVGERMLVPANGGSATIQISRPRALVGKDEPFVFCVFAAPIEYVERHPEIGPLVTWRVTEASARAMRGAL